MDTPFPKIVANIIINDLMKYANRKKCTVVGLGLSSVSIYWLALMISYDVLSSEKVSKVIGYMVEHTDKTPYDAATELDLWPKYNDDELEETINKVIAENPKAIGDIKSGKNKAFGFLIGQIKKIDPKSDSKEVMSMLKEKCNGC